MYRLSQSRAEQGATSLQVVVLMVPVFLGLMGFAVDLGRLYMIKGELKTAANARALAAAGQLIGTDASLDAAASAAEVTVNNEGGFGNKYDFGGIVVGGSSGILTSDAGTPEFFTSAAAAMGLEDETGGGEGSGQTAKHVRVRVTADAPLIFWGLLAQGLERRTPIVQEAVAGRSAPLCTACGIEPMAIQAVNADDLDHFGLIVGQRYTLGYQCTGAPVPPPLAGDTTRLQFLLLNRFNDAAEIFAEEQTQLYRIGAGGLPPSSNPAVSCMTVGTDELVWPNATPVPCSQNRVPGQAVAFVCGLAARLDSAVPAACENITESQTITTIYAPDTDTQDITDYAAYTGQGRRIVTVPVVNLLTGAGNMTVLGFRQFVVTLSQSTSSIDPTDRNARFSALYIGFPAPLRQGRIGGCSQTAGPGRVVLHQ